jgi:mRNA-degrading endonuclease toxin of MazEF toxin-antitoxin module
LLTGQLSSAVHPGNFRLRPDEGGLPEHSAVNTSQILTLDRRIYLQDEDYIGCVDPETMPEILKGVRLQIEGFKFDP